ncbi:MaoC/PaaZ C-terminal domain-containing protein [Bacillus massiliglaciei]|uniref:MaoC/PaaZ C-terminal domain-containing protein n=1 Tax=Bacillus massiliglaciei TaxID=1816693 RepID=UPI000AC23EC6|nr:MaoC/PaaZ C-terminal domain-containing protein [Bacillus massiliglaciei]
MKKLAFKITEEEVEQYAVVLGDNNPIHLDIETAKQQGFSNKIVHGMLTAAKVLMMVSNEILTPQERVCQHEFTFTSPVYLEVQITLTIKQMEHKIRVEGKCGEKVVIKGWLAVSR